MDNPTLRTSSSNIAGEYRRRRLFDRKPKPKLSCLFAGTEILSPHAYQRRRDLPGLLPLWSHELLIQSRTDHEELLQRLRQALRAERRRGNSGHWSYDLTRHTNLLHAYRTEMKLFGAKWGAQ